MNIDEIILNFLKANIGKAFTLESLSKRIEEKFQNLEQLEYFQRHNQGLLNRLAFSFLINTEEYNGKDYYFV